MGRNLTGRNSAVNSEPIQLIQGMEIRTEKGRGDPHDTPSCHVFTDLLPS